MNYIQKQLLHALKDKRAKTGGMAGGIGFALVAVLVVTLVVLMITAIAPSIFANSSNISGAPSFFSIMYPLLIGFALIIVLIVIIMMMLKKVQ